MNTAGASAFPEGFFDRSDDEPDHRFYAVDRLVTHIDGGAIAAVTELYRDLGLGGDVLDLCSSWISHFDPAPARLTALGMNEAELAANPAAASVTRSTPSGPPVSEEPRSDSESFSCRPM